VGGVGEPLDHRVAGAADAVAREEDGIGAWNLVPSESSGSVKTRKAGVYKEEKSRISALRRAFWLARGRARQRRGRGARHRREGRGRRRSTGPWTQRRRGRRRWSKKAGGGRKRPCFF
jgi:hypothetical protein